MDIHERDFMIDEAEMKIAEAIDLITEAVKGTSEEATCGAYIIPHLQTWIGNGNPYDHHTGKIKEGLFEWNNENYSE